jgi:hypothetical protein
MSLTVFDQYGPRPHFMSAISRSSVSEFKRIAGWELYGAAS